MTSPYPDTVSISGVTAEGLSAIGIGDIGTCETVERMSFVVVILRRLPDRCEWFPLGHWATIQRIEEQIDAAIDARVNKLNIKGLADLKRISVELEEIQSKYGLSGKEPKS